MTELEEKLELIREQHGLLSLLKQNDIEELTVLEFLVEEGYLDIEDYFYRDVPQYVLDEED